MKNLDEILHKSIALSKMNSNDPKFGDCLFELTNLMRAKGDVGIISDIIFEAIRIHKSDHFDDHLSNELPSLGNDESIDMVRNLRTAELIIRGLPRNLIGCLPTFKCAYTIWKFLEE